MNWYKNFFKFAQKISDFVKKLDRVFVLDCKNKLRGFLNGKVNNVYLEILVNFFTLLYSKERIQSKDISTVISGDWNQFGDFITAGIGGTYRNLFVTGEPSRENLNIANDKYHRDLQTGNKNKGPTGQPIVDVSSSLIEFAKRFPDVYSELSSNFNPELWRGWTWVSLGCGYSQEEGDAGGHCGNIGSTRGDNIISLRDPGNRVHLTFITKINTGMVGESKATNNQKPGEVYHPAIVSLLLSGYIKGIAGGGYLPKHNFALQDIKNQSLRDLINNNFAQTEKHKQPENYQKLEWLDQWDQTKIDSLDIKQKAEVLNNIFALFKNYAVFSPYDYIEDENTEYNDNFKLNPDFKVIKLNFNLSKLVKEVFYYSSDLKTKINLFSKANGANYSNKWATKRDLKVFRSDIRDIEDSEELKNVRAIPSINISDKDIEDMVGVIEKETLNSNISLRYKAKVREILEEKGYQEDENSNEKENKFSSTIEKIDQEIINNTLKTKEIKDYAENSFDKKLGDFLVLLKDKYESQGFLSFYNDGFTQDRKKIMLHINYPYPEQERHNDGWGIGKKGIPVFSKEIENKVISSIEKYKHLFLRKGISFAVKRGKLYGYIFNEIIKRAQDIFSRRMISLYPKKIKIKNSEKEYDTYNMGSLIIFLDAILCLEEIVYIIEPNTIENMFNTAQSEYGRIFNSILKDIDKIILEKLQDQTFINKIKEAFNSKNWYKLSQANSQNIDIPYYRIVTKTFLGAGHEREKIGEVGPGTYWTPHWSAIVLMCQQLFRHYIQFNRTIPKADWGVKIYKIDNAIMADPPREHAWARSTADVDEQVLVKALSEPKLIKDIYPDSLDFEEMLYQREEVPRGFNGAADITYNGVKYFLAPNYKNKTIEVAIRERNMWKVVKSLRNLASLDAFLKEYNAGPDFDPQDQIGWAIRDFDWIKDFEE
jgi:hypothetical protein